MTKNEKEGREGKREGGKEGEVTLIHQYDFQKVCPFRHIQKSRTLLAQCMGKEVQEEWN